MNDIIDLVYEINNFIIKQIHIIHDELIVISANHILIYDLDCYNNVIKIKTYPSSGPYNYQSLIYENKILLLNDNKINIYERI